MSTQNTPNPTPNPLYAHLVGQQEQSARAALISALRAIKPEMRVEEVTAALAVINDEQRRKRAIETLAELPTDDLERAAGLAK